VKAHPVDATGFAVCWVDHAAPFDRSASRPPTAVHALAEEQETAERAYWAPRGAAAILQTEATATLAPTNHAAATTTPTTKPRRRFDQNAAPTSSFVRDDTADISRPDTITRSQTKTISGTKSLSTVRWVKDYPAGNIARNLNVTSLPDRAMSGSRWARAGVGRRKQTEADRLFVRRLGMIDLAQDGVARLVGYVCSRT
jgi:hypothetical protein